MSSRKQWRLQAKLDRRFKSGHPWVYSNELQGSPKGVEPGELVTLSDAGGAFLAHGYANAHSLICFRAVSRMESEADAALPAGVARRIEKAWALRRALGFESTSCRLVFGEADELPGLIVDRFVSGDGKSVLVVQGQTAGADRWTQQWMEIMKGVNLEWDAIVIKNDSSARKWEGLEQQEAKILKASSPSRLSEVQLRDFSMRLRPGITFHVNLLEGQKTGFFLDQWANTELFISRMGADLVSRAKSGPAPRSIRILDLCCYVGQWSVQLSHFLKGAGVRADITLVDASESALELAEKNVKHAASDAKVTRLQGNVLKDLGDLPSQVFDVVISDPPALIKNRKDIPTGTHAYLQLHTQALRLAAPGGWLVACSCSGLFTEEAFGETLAKGARRNGLTGSGVQWVARGGQSPDHPLLADFPEGRYLKAWLGRIS